MICHVHEGRGLISR